MAAAQNFTQRAPTPMGLLIQELRLDQGWSRRELAERAGIAESTVSRIELYGMVPLLGNLTAVASALDVDVTELLSAE